MKDINTLTVADLTEDAPPFTGWRWATEEAISAWGQAMKHGDKDVLDLAGKVKRQLDMMVVAPRAGKPVDFQAAYEYLNEKGVHYIGPSHLVEFALLLDYKERFAKPAQDSTWGSSTLADLDAALDGAHELSGAPHERISELIRQRDEAQARLLKIEKEFEALKKLCAHAETAAAEAQVELKGLRAAQSENFTQAGSKPVATLHDDGHYVWKGAKPHDFNYAGWRMEVYAEPYHREVIVPLKAQVSVSKALLGGVEAKVVTSIEGSVAAFIVNIQLTGWNLSKEHAEGYVRGFNHAAKWMQQALTEKSKTVREDVIDHCWRMYQQGQISADHTDKEVFAEVIQSFAKWNFERPEKIMSDDEILAGAAYWLFESQAATTYIFSPAGFITCVRKIIEGTK